ncbi:MAG: hypothetical protein ACYTF6_07870 [Planctomycetota bacterium]|jgi:hypothetical protein
MKSRKILTYSVIVICGLVLAAGVVLLALQWAQRAGFNLYGYPYTIHVHPDGKTAGGINTALLMLLSALGGIVAVFLVRFIFWAIRLLRRRAKAPQAPPEQAQRQPPATA